ncbi:DUF2187 domain-containing protein [Lapidilactobacillus achengensis]|uniref:DUF2187 domain-containing protein n=1 Tax=Lapidilactobacillus achengensis TaxID=2486000 RepID=A0ABW1UN98_9LACO|nr:DUF2187 domain-containing protein [Lapidilactobacillus achengensis]
MEITAIKIGDQFKCQVKEDMDYHFTGEVEKIYEHAVLLHIIEHDARDNENVYELNNRIVVNCKQLSAIA